jgi:hypothetical protein
MKDISSLRGLTQISCSRFITLNENVGHWFIILLILSTRSMEYACTFELIELHS